MVCCRNAVLADAAEDRAANRSHKEQQQIDSKGWADGGRLGIGGWMVGQVGDWVAQRSIGQNRNQSEKDAASKVCSLKKCARIGTR